MEGRKILMLTLGILLAGAFVYAITITEITPGADITTSNDSIVIEYNFTADVLNNLTWSWDGTNYTFYDDSLVLFYNFDNRSALGEDDVTVKDLSMYGNNGSVVGGENITWIPNGKYGGAFNFSGEDGTYINLSSLEGSAIENNNFSIGAWIYPKQGDRNVIAHAENTGTARNFAIGISTGQGFDVSFYNYSNSAFRCVTWNGCTPSGTTPYDTWSYIFVNVDVSNKNYSLYVNGVLKGSLSWTGDLQNQTTKFTLGQIYPNQGKWNGSIDDVMIFNKTFSSNEILELYKSQITKYNSSDWGFYTNQTLNASINSTTPSYDWDFNLCISNSTDNVICGIDRIITQVIDRKTLISNFSSGIGTIRSDFYGTNIRNWIGGGMAIDTNGDGVQESLSNLTEHRRAFSNTGMGYIRIDSLIQYNANEDHTFAIDNYYNITAIANGIEYAYNNNLRVLLIVSGTPLWLANKTTSCKNNNYTCTPTNYTRWGEMVVDLLDNVTNNGEYSTIIDLDVWNEPDLTSMLIDEPQEFNINKSYFYNNIFNTTLIQVKAVYPHISIGGPVTATQDNRSILIWNGFLGNFSNGIDFFSHHRYKYTYSDIGLDYGEILNKYYLEIQGNCSLYSANCSRVVYGEFNYANSSAMNTSSKEMYKELTLAYMGMLNNYPNNISLINYQWSERYNYNNTIYYPQYPYLWSMFSESALDNVYYPPYNVTSNFAHLCPAGGEVYESSSSDDVLKVVSCKDSENYNVIVINTDTESRNISLNLSGNYPYKALKNYETGKIYNVNSMAELGILDSYGIFYLNGLDGGLSKHTKFTENTGTTLYDISGNADNGDIVGATWNNDNILNSLVSGTDYNFAKPLFTLLNTDYLYYYLTTTYSTSHSRSDMEDIQGNYSLSLLNISERFPIIGTIMGVMILISILVLLLIFALKKMMGSIQITTESKPKGGRLRQDSSDFA